MVLFGKWLTYALLAVSLDLVWGYCGILSLGHGAFFALGGYAMGMYPMRQIGPRGVYAHPVLPDFMVFLNWKELPVAWWGFDHFPYALLMVLLVPGVLAFALGWFAFRARVTGVYLSIITQAMTYALLLGFFRNNFGFGGNNGLTDFKDILGFNVQAAGTRAALFALSALALAGGFLIARGIVTLEARQGAGRDPRRREPRPLPRLQGRALQALRIRGLGHDGGPCRRALRAAGRHHQPFEFSPANSIEAVIWVAVGGRGTLTGAALGAVIVNAAKSWFTGALPEYWLFALGGLFCRRRCCCRRASSARFPSTGRGAATAARLGFPRPPPPSRRSSRHGARTTQALLYVDGVSVSFDGFRALNNLSLVMDPGEMRAIIGPNGAGKTTMMDVITGKTRPDEGDVVFQGSHDLTALDEAAIATLGIGRKFQKPTVFEFHTVADNVLLALKGERGVFANLVHRLSGAEQRPPRRDSLDREAQGPPRRARREPQPWPEAMARDRHAPGAGPGPSSRRRAGRRHDRLGDRAKPRSSCAASTRPIRSSSSSTT